MHIEQGRIPPEYTKLVVLAAMTLPGTLIVYYGEEIGMTSDLEAISCDLAQVFGARLALIKYTYMINF